MKRFLLIILFLLIAVSAQATDVTISIPTLSATLSSPIYEEMQRSNTEVSLKSGYWAVYGNAQIDTAQSKFGGSSMLLDGTGDYIAFSNNSNTTLGNNNFTFEAWIRLTSNADWGEPFSKQVDSNNRMLFYKHSNGLWYFNAYVGGVEKAGYSMVWNPSLNTWYHVAIVRYGSAFSIYIDGAAKTITTITAISNNNIDNAGSLKSGSYVNGWIDELRYSNTARYTANFTPSASEFTVDTNTISLNHFAGADASTIIADTQNMLGGYSSTSPTAILLKFGGVASSTFKPSTFINNSNLASEAGNVKIQYCCFDSDDASDCSYNGSWLTVAQFQAVGDIANKKWCQLKYQFNGDGSQDASMADSSMTVTLPAGAAGGGARIIGSPIIQGVN